MEPATGDLLAQKPRDPKEPILSRSLMGRIGVYGLLIAAATMAAYFMGLNSGGERPGHDAAFATLTLARCSTASTAGDGSPSSPWAF